MSSASSRRSCRKSSVADSTRTPDAAGVTRAVAIRPSARTRHVRQERAGLSRSSEQSAGSSIPGDPHGREPGGSLGHVDAGAVDLDSGHGFHFASRPP